jgi:hypothetical protein
MLKKFVLALFLTIAAVAWGFAYYSAEGTLAGDPPRGDCSGGNC